MPRPAAISHEGNDRLFLSVTAVQEGAHRRSHCEYPGQGASGDGAGAFDVHTALPDVDETFLPLKTPLLRGFAAGVFISS